MPNLRIRTIFAAGDSLVVSLPPEWLRGNGVRSGDQVELRYNGEVRIRPKRREKEVSDGLNPVEPTLA